jgi:hypothetical protein
MAVTELRRRQGILVRAVLGRLEGRTVPMPAWGLEPARLVGLATGLTALAAHLWRPGEPAIEATLRAHLDEQAEQVARRAERLRDVIPGVMRALAEAEVPAVVVKGHALADAVWGLPASRPMADVDVVVPPTSRAVAGAALERAGLRWWSSNSHEDAYLAWGDGGAGRLDGESADHNGRVELHPGWSEHLHGYDVDGFDVIGAAAGGSLPLAPLTAQALGHLGACVVRAEVRAVNVVDAWWCSRAGVDWIEVERWAGEADPRLVAPAMWLVGAVAPGVVPVEVVDRQLARLPSAARGALERSGPDDVWRDPTARTSIGWRQAFARTPSERARVIDQAAFAGRPRTLGTVRARLHR